MNNEPSYIIINLDGVRINIRLRFGASLLTLVPKMTGSWRLAECTSPIDRDLIFGYDLHKHFMQLILKFGQDLQHSLFIT